MERQGSSGRAAAAGMQSLSRRVQPEQEEAAAFLTMRDRSEQRTLRLHEKPVKNHMPRCVSCKGFFMPQEGHKDQMVCEVCGGTSILRSQAKNLSETADQVSMRESPAVILPALLSTSGLTVVLALVWSGECRSEPVRRRWT